MPKGIVQPFRSTPVYQNRQQWVDYLLGKGGTEAMASATWSRLSESAFYENDTYLVQVDKNPPHQFRGAVVWMLWIKRHDNDHNRDPLDFQAIKDQLVGKDVEAVELYPAESRLCDGANRTGLVCFLSLNGAPYPQFPVGPNPTPKLSRLTGRNSPAGVL
jgi:hypothetical protein